MAAVSELRCRSGLRHVEVVADPIPWWFRKGPAPYREPGPQEPPVLVVLAVNAAGEPLALECPGCRTHHTLDGQPVGRAADIVHLSSSGEFAQAAGRLIKRDQQQPLAEDLS